MAQAGAGLHGIICHMLVIFGQKPLIDPTLQSLAGKSS